MLSEILIINIGTCVASSFIYKPIKRALSIIVSNYIDQIESDIQTGKEYVKNLEKDKQELLVQKENFPSKRDVLLNKAKHDAQTLIENDFKKITKNYDAKTNAINNALIYRYNEICNNMILNCLSIITNLLSEYIKNINNTDSNTTHINDIEKTLLNMIKK